MDEIEVNQVDINTASLEEIDAIPGVGTSLAQRIIDARPFTDIDDLLRVNGIGENFANKLAPYITFSKPSTSEEVKAKEDTDVNKASESEVISKNVVEEVSKTSVDEIPAENESVEIPVEESDASIQTETDVEDASYTVLDEGEESDSTEETEQADEQTPDETEGEATAGKAEGTKPETTTEPASPVKSSGVGKERSGMDSKTIWLVIGASLITWIVTMILVFGILAGLNGGNLTYVSPADFNSLTAQVNDLDNRMTTVEDSISGIRERLDNLEALSGRVAQVEQTAEELQTQNKKLTSQVDELSSQVNQMSEDVETLKEFNSRYSTFMENLRDLLITLFPPTEE
jgi:competence ComEA-like helix-hairpin-helix protein